MKNVAASSQAGLQRQRQPEIRRPLKGAAEVARSDAYHLDVMAIQIQGVAQYMRISPEAVLPEVVAHHRHFRGGGGVVFRQDRPAHERAHAQNLEIVARDAIRHGLFRMAADDLRKSYPSGFGEIGGHNRLSRAPQRESLAGSSSEQAGETCGVVPIIRVVRIREKSVLSARSSRDLHYAVRFGDRHRS